MASDRNAVRSIGAYSEPQRCRWQPKPAACDVWLVGYRHLHAVVQLNVPYLYCGAHMLAIRLPRAIEKRLEELARRTGRTKSFIVREAILEHLEDLEDIYLAERTLQRIRTGKERAIPLEDVLNRNGVED
jgi:RHH-type rel operon transcriptional repressor/antitoxin RelB